MPNPVAQCYPFEAQLVAADTVDRCAPCITAAAVAQILASELGVDGTQNRMLDSERETGRAIARSALRQYYRPMGEP